MTAGLRWYTYLKIETDTFLRNLTAGVVDEGDMDEQGDWEDVEQDADVEGLDHLSDCCSLCFSKEANYDDILCIVF